jgi:hypothetical protein
MHCGHLPQDKGLRNGLFRIWNTFFLLSVHPLRSLRLSTNLFPASSGQKESKPNLKTDQAYIPFVVGEAAGDASGVIAGGVITAGLADEAGTGASEASGVMLGDGTGVAIDSGVAEGFSIGRNSVCLIRPPASAVQMLSPMEMAAPSKTAQPIQAA